MQQGLSHTAVSAVATLNKASKKLATGLLALTAAMAMSASHAKEWKEIRIATDATYPPFESVAPDGSLVGFEMDYARALCEEMKVTCVISNPGWDALIPGLNARKFDAVMASMNITDDRLKAVDFSDVYYRMKNQFVAASGSNIEISKEGLKGKNIVVQTGTPQENFVREQFGDVAHISGYVKADEPFLDLQSGRADLTFGNKVQIDEGFLKKPGGEKFGFVGPVYDGRDYPVLGRGVAVAMRKNEAELKAMFNTAIQSLKEKGITKQLQAKYFDYDLSE
ncbi:transporter substrate-binding domain-containing protein [Pokkaliibacter sp. MBI-7]|uniref:transporter substrate-binding domain-containing protein n=1 Tax=Pokkaliibacter sp. MBI-7 TaxID=3040600 RepID=UPI00244AA5EF|nr:transporter substrate-binding domain-containing protein [Pokkaliibacter sp. MBI-7]MDH2432042.1 transporter substrate-binding domain-containing protein [Pokkaliibacter sp. MBI-7]